MYKCIRQYNFEMHTRYLTIYTFFAKLCLYKCLYSGLKMISEMGTFYYGKELLKENPSLHKIRC